MAHEIGSHMILDHMSLSYDWASGQWHKLARKMGTQK